MENIWKKGTWESNLVGDLLVPFDPKELVQLAAHPERDSSERLTRLILRAVAAKDARFQYLLGQRGLRKDPVVDLALLAFDYAVNHNQEALHSILSKQASDPYGWDSSEVMVLAHVDEWDLTKKTFESHVMCEDGSGDDARYGFWLTRRYLFQNNKRFPHKYKQFVDELKAKQKQTEKASHRRTD